MKPDDVVGKLKDCPFCGSGARSFNSVNNGFHVRCLDSGCGAIGPWGSTIESAYEAWNRRAKDAEIKVLEELLEKARLLLVRAKYDSHDDDEGYPKVREWNSLKCALFEKIDAIGREGVKCPECDGNGLEEGGTTDDRCHWCGGSGNRKDWPDENQKER